MTNHALIRTNTPGITPEKVKNLLEEIVARRFKGIFQIEADGNYFSLWISVPASPDYPDGQAQVLGITINSKRSIHLRKGYPHGDVSWWIQGIVQEEIAAALEGLCGDEGVSETWKPDPGRFTTIREYSRCLHGQFFSKLQFLVNKDTLPPQLRPFLGD